MRKSLRILDSKINFLGEIDDYEEFNITRRFNSVGEFELKISANKNGVDKLQKNNLVLIGSDYNKVCIIMHREFSYGEKGEKTDQILITGLTLQGLTSRRLIVPDVSQDYDSFVGSQEAIMKYFIDRNCINPIDSKRIIPYLHLSNNKDRGIDDRWRSSYEPLNEKLKSIAEYSNLGWNIYLDYKNKKFIFDVLEGKDLTVNQKENPPVIFRSDFNNIRTRKYIESIINSKNTCYVGTKEDSEKLVLSVGDTEGFERLEVFHDFSEDDVTLIKKEGEIQLKELEPIETFELEVNPNNTFYYERDYDLGDIVTVQDKKLGVTMDTPITEIKETYNKNGLNIVITFGKSIPTLIETLKRKVK